MDVSNLAQQPISSLKARFNYWFDKCSWHKPSVLILDNLDKLLSAEVEVRSIIQNAYSFLDVSLISIQTPFVRANSRNCSYGFFRLLRGLHLSTPEQFF